MSWRFPPRFFHTIEHCICCKSLNLINQFSFPVFTAFSKWCRFAMDHNLSWDIWHDKLDQAREGREKWNLYQKQTKQKFHLMMLLSTLSSSFRIEFYTRHLNQNVNLALIRFDSLSSQSNYEMSRQNSGTYISVLDHFSAWCMQRHQTVIWLETGGSLMGIDVPQFSINDTNTKLTFADWNSNGLSFKLIKFYSCSTTWMFNLKLYYWTALYPC